MMTKMRGIPETHPVTLAEISISCCRGLTCSLLLKLALQVEGPSTVSITQEMFGESFQRHADIGLETRKKKAILQLALEAKIRRSI